MKRLTLVLALLMGVAFTASAHNAHEAVMEVDLGMSFAGGQKVSIKYKALNLGTGSTWTKLKAGEISRPFPIGEMTTSAPIKCGTASVPAGTHRLFFLVDKQGNQSLMIGGTRQKPGPKVAIETTSAPQKLEHLMLTTIQGEGDSDFMMVMVFGSSMGMVMMDVQ
jgi:hypothetical protein